MFPYDRWTNFYWIYFKLGNDEIKQRSDDPNAINVSQTVNSNVNTLIGNYMFYLNEINNEKSYSNIGLDLIAKGIDQYFTDLVNLYPNSDYAACCASGCRE